MLDLLSKKNTIAPFKSDFIEKSILDKTIRTKKSLEYFSPASWEGQTKFFYGKENESQIFLTRTKTPIERILFPKAVVEFDKNDFTKYKIRLSLLGYLVGLLILVSVFGNLFFASWEEIQREFLQIISLCLGFIGFYLMDIQIAERKIKQALRQ